MNKNCFFDRENIAKLLLEKIIEKEPMDKVKHFIFNIDSKKQDEIIINEKFPLSNFDLISIIYKYMGMVNLLKCFLEVIQININKRKEKKNRIKNRNIKKLVAPKLHQKNQKRAKENLTLEPEEKESIMRSMASNEQHLTQFDINSLNVNVKKEDNNINDIINIESSTSSENYINLGVYSEVKTYRKKNIILNSLNESSPEIQEGINSEIKISKPFKEINKECNSFSYHYELNNGKLYKYYFVEINKENNLATFACDDPKCNAYAEYDINSKIFKIIFNHSINYHEHRYIRYLSEKDSQILNYMKNNNCNQLQLKKTNA